jgi:hypothetical protein
MNQRRPRKIDDGLAPVSLATVGLLRYRRKAAPVENRTVLVSLSHDQIVEHQRTQARQNGFKPDLVLADHGVSGVSTHLCERPEGRRLFDILREGDALVVRWVDGLGRGSAKRRQGGFASGRLVKDCLWLDTAASNSGRMVTFRHRVDRLQLAFRPSRAEAYQCSNMDLPPKRCPCPHRHTVGHLGRRRDASPCH